jgi:hypothetical protein
MKKDKDQTNERAIWEMYQKKCSEEGTTPSVQGFKEWTTALMKRV